MLIDNNSHVEPKVKNNTKPFAFTVERATCYGISSVNTVVFRLVYHCICAVHMKYNMLQWNTSLMWSINVYTKLKLHRHKSFPWSCGKLLAKPLTMVKSTSIVKPLFMREAEWAIVFLMGLWKTVNFAT